MGREEGKVELKVLGEKEEKEERTAEEEVGGKRDRSTWPGEATSYKGSHRWGGW